MIDFMLREHWSMPSLGKEPYGWNSVAESIISHPDIFQHRHRYQSNHDFYVLMISQCPARVGDPDKVPLNFTHAEVVQQNFIYICCGVSATALLVYEYLVTFDREYQLVWKRKFSAATFIFLLARYPILLGLISTLPSIYPLTPKSCSALVWFSTVVELLLPVFLAAFSTLRAYAISGRRWQMASLIFILSTVRVGVNVFQFVRQRVIEAPPPINCTSMRLISPEVTNILIYLSRATIIVADILLLVVTIRRTYRTRRIAKDANIKTSLNSLILRDGTLYFIALVILGIIDVISTYLGEATDLGSYANGFIDPINAILVSRFILNLREVGAIEGGNEDPIHSSFVHSIRFAAFVDPLGAPLDHDFSFSALNPDTSDEQETGGESEHCEDALDDSAGVMLDQANIHRSSSVHPE